jgi:hypothetical protein
MVTHIAAHSHRSFNPHLLKGKAKLLRPTQITAGYWEVAQKRKQWMQLGEKDRHLFLSAHCFPCVLGPKGKHYIVDHHHLGLALLQERIEDVMLHVLADLSTLSGATFWRVMEHHQWVHPYDDRGVKQHYDAIPKTLKGLQDDVYRSLAGELRHAGGYSKDITPFSEFLWADFLRTRIAASLVLSNFEEALADALELAHHKAAHYLPGWSGKIVR